MDIGVRAKLVFNTVDTGLEPGFVYRFIGRRTTKKRATAEVEASIPHTAEPQFACGCTAR